MVTTPVFEHLFNIGQGLKSFDTSGNHRHSVLSGNPSWVAGRKGKAIQLDGTDDAFVAPVTENVNEDFTVAFWVQNWVPGSGGAGLGILALQTASDIHATNNSLIIYKDFITGEIKVACYDTNPLLVGTLESGSTASSGFMCVRKTGLTVSFFLNGVFVDEIDISELNNFSWVLVGLTAYNYAKADWIDKIRYWDSALSDEEIEYWYAKDKPRWNDSCVLWLRGDEENGTAVKDYSPQANDGVLTATLNDGAITGASWVVDEEKGKCLSFDGVNDYGLVDYDSVFDFGTGNFSVCAWVKYSPNIVGEHVIVRKDHEGVTPRRFFNLRLINAKNLVFGLYDSGLSKSTPAVDCSDDEWHFAVGVRDGDDITLYVDGVAGAPTSGCAAMDMTNVGGNIAFGRYQSTAAGFFNGVIRDCRVYNRALTEPEISTLYNRTAEVSYGCVGKWLLNEGSGLTAYDSHNRFTAKRGNALKLDGSTEYVSVPSTDIQNLEHITICAHFKLDNYIAGHDEICCQQWNHHRIFVDATTKTIQFYEYISGATQYAVGSVIELNRNYYVIAVYDGSALKIYIDNVLVGQTDYAGSLNSNVDPLLIGNYCGATGRFNGVIDEFMIFNRALTSTEIKRVYEADGFLDYIPLRIQDGSLVVSVDSVGVQWDSWANGACRRKHLGLGKNVAYTFTVLEEVSDVSWIDSAAYILKEKKDSGTPLDLYIKKTDVLAAESTSVVIDSMNVRYSPTMQVRYIDFSVREQ